MTKKKKNESNIFKIFKKETEAKDFISSKTDLQV